MCEIHLEILGFMAGLTNLISLLPQLLANLRNRAAAASQNAARNACQCAGNGMGLAYGLSVGSLAMTTFSLLGSVMAGALMWQVWAAKRDQRLGGGLA